MMCPLTNKNYSQVGSKFNPTLLLLLVCVASFTFVQASAQESETGYNLRIRTEPSILFIDGGGFYSEGITVSIDEAPETWREYTFVGWKVDGIWADGNPITIRMDGPHTVTAVYSKEIGGSILVDAIPRIAEITVDGTIYLPDELPVSFSWSDGSSHVISAESIVKESPETRYVFDSWKDKKAASDRTITIGPDTQEIVALFKTQHFLKPITEFGQVTGGGWHDEGKTATFELESDIVIDKKDDYKRYSFDSWDLGDYPNSVRNSLDIIEPITVKASWTPQYKLTLRTSVPEYDLFGTGWSQVGKQVALIAEEELESSNSNVRYVFDRWVSKGPNPVIIPNAHSALTTITIEDPYVIEAVYKESYRVNVWSQFGSPIGAGFYKSGEIAEISLSNNKMIIEPNKIRMVFQGWNAAGAKTMNTDSVSTSDGILAQNLLIMVDRPLNITTNWKTQYYLDVQTQEGKAKGSGWYDLGRMVPFSLDKASTPPGMWSAEVFDQWTGDVDSTKISDRVIMNEPKTVIAVWKSDSTPGIINAGILAGIAGVAAVIYSKTHKKVNLESKIPELGKASFEKFFSMRNTKQDTSPSFYKKPKKSILDWLLGRES